MTEHPYQPGDVVLCARTGRPLLVVRCERHHEKHAATVVVCIAVYALVDTQAADGSVNFPNGRTHPHPEDPGERQP